MRIFNKIIAVGAFLLCFGEAYGATGADRTVKVKPYDVITIKVGEVVDVYSDNQWIVRDFWEGSMSSCWVDHAWVMYRNSQSDPAMSYVKVSNTNGSLGLSTLVGLAESPSRLTLRIYYSITWMYPGDNTKYVAQSEYQFYVNVVDERPKELTAISLPDKKTVEQGETFRLSPVLTPSNAKTELKWMSTKEDVATVDQSGMVTAVKSGRCDIVVTASNGLSAKCEVSVAPAPTSVSISAPLKSLSQGYSMQLKAVVSPSSANPSVTWASSNESVLFVSAAGVLKAKEVGSATITVKTKNGKTASIDITVVKAEQGQDYRNVGSRVQAVKALVNRHFKNRK